MNTPTDVTRAFHPTSTKIGLLELRPFTMAQHMFLEHIKSPLLGDAKCELIDTARALVVMSRPIAETKNLWNKDRPNGDEPSAAFEAEAWEMADRIAMSDLQTLPQTLREHIDRGFSTAVPMKSPDVPGREGASPFPESQPSQADSVGS